MSGPILYSPSLSESHDADRINEYLRQKGFVRVSTLGQGFMANSSSDFYDEWWMFKELFQNFSDYSYGDKKLGGNIDGVDIDLKKNADGTSTMTITGHWPLEDYTHLMYFGTGKQDINNAGGNGAGVKQVATILGNREAKCAFKITGERWAVEYFHIGKRHINDLEKEGWSVVGLKPDSNTGICKYEITLPSDHPLFTCIPYTHEMFLCRENHLMQAPDFSHPNIIIRWGQSREEVGNLFVGGQISNYADGDEIPGRKWKGIPGVSCALQGLDEIGKQRTLDRQGTDTKNLVKLLKEAVSKLTITECVQILETGKHIWVGDGSAQYSIDKKGYLGLLSMVIERIGNLDRQYSVTAILNDGKKYAACCSDSQKNKKAAAAGYILCPCYFSEIGLISTRDIHLETTDEVALSSRPQHVEHIRNTYGIGVHFDTLEGAEDQYWKLWNTLGKCSQERKKIYCMVSLPAADMMKVRNIPHQIQQIRDLIGTGLEKGWLVEPCYCIIGGKMYNFGIRNNDLMVNSPDKKISEEVGIYLSAATDGQKFIPNTADGGTPKTADSRSDTNPKGAKVSVENEIFLGKSIQDWIADPGQLNQKEIDALVIRALEITRQHPTVSNCLTVQVLIQISREKGLHKNAQSHLAALTVIMHVLSTEAQARIQEAWENWRNAESDTTKTEGGDRLSHPTKEHPHKYPQTKDSPQTVRVVIPVSKNKKKPQSRSLLVASIVLGSLLTVGGTVAWRDKEKVGDALAKIKVFSDPSTTIGAGKNDSYENTADDQYTVNNPSNNPQTVSTGKGKTSQLSHSDQAGISGNNATSTPAKVAAIVDPPVTIRKPGKVSSQNTLDFERVKGVLDLTEKAGSTIGMILEESQSSATPSRLKQRVKEGVSAYAEEPVFSEDIEDFEILHGISQEIKIRLNALISYLHIATGVEIKAKFFVFRGRGAYGINIKKEGIGIHEDVLKGDFQTALTTLIHEVSHMHVMGHNEDFISAEEALFQKLQSTLEKTHDSSGGLKNLLMQQRNAWEMVRP